MNLFAGVVSVVIFFAAYFTGFGLIGFFSFIPLLFALKRISNLQSALLLGSVCGIIFQGFSFFWISNFKFSFCLYAILFQCLYFILFTTSAYFLLRNLRGSAFAWLCLPFIWVAIEYLRSLGVLGVPFVFIGYSVMPSISLAQLASVTGIWGLSFLVFFVNCVGFLLITNIIKFKQKIYLMSCFVLVLLCIFMFGKHSLYKFNPGNMVRVSVVQPNISVKNKWNIDKLYENIKVHKDLTKDALANDNPLFVVWPETSVRCFLLHPKRKDVLQDLLDFSSEIKTSLCIGSEDFRHDEKGKHAWNISLLLSPNDKGINTYAKHKLIPFIERAPLRSMIPFLIKKGIGGIYEQGDKYTIFRAGDIAFSTVICLEGLFPAFVRMFVKNGAEVIVNMTNDEPSLGEWKFLYRLNAEMLRVRAIENGRSFVRAANNGISMFIDPFGRVIKENKPFERGFLTASIPVSHEKTFFTRYGNWFAYLSVFVSCILIFVKKRV